MRPTRQIHLLLFTLPYLLSSLSLCRDVEKESEEPEVVIVDEHEVTVFF